MRIKLFLHLPHEQHIPQHCCALCNKRTNCTYAQAHPKHTNTCTYTHKCTFLDANPQSCDFAFERWQEQVFCRITSALSALLPRYMWVCMCVFCFTPHHLSNACPATVFNFKAWTAKVQGSSSALESTDLAASQPQGPGVAELIMWGKH